MVFDSFTFLVFFALFIGPYHLLWRWWRAQNLVLLAASSVFYGWWDWRFLGLMFGTSFVDYVSGRMLGSLTDERRRKWVLGASVGLNLAVLFLFKYFNFFADSLVSALRSVGVEAHAPSLRIILPVGISFYTFQSISYAVDCYRGLIKPERNLISYFTFVCCFPHLVAGPIQRASHLLAQLNQPRVVTEQHAREAVWLLSWGFFLKQVISNSAASFVGMAFHEDARSGWTTILGTLAFAIQIYCDFNAYSLIARGTGRLIGLEFTWNFNQPYFATSPQDFWRRWHISLSNWLRDYLYIPLGGSRGGEAATYRNLMLTMLLGGLWHGAAWTFVLWGALHGAALCAHRLLLTLRKQRELPDAIGWAATMAVVLVGWFLFRCQSFAMVRAMVASLGNLGWTAQHGRVAWSLLAIAAPVAAVEIWQYRARDLAVPSRMREPVFALVTGALVVLTAGMFNRMTYEFIYFQF
jgi:alginate O-acetyltransferase complex protein AlgI